MKSLLVFLRIIVVGILWGIIFTEGLRVIMLCNWHFDIFWPDHWRQFMKVWQAGWVVRAPKEWAFVLLIITYIPMLLTGWWTLSLVAWEELIYKAATFPLTLYNRLLKAPISNASPNNRYGVAKRKSYKQIRPVGINALRVPISDYDNTTAPALANSAPAYSGYPASSLSNTTTRVTTPAAKKTDVSATIDHALFKFDDDDDDDFDLDIDSFEKADIKKKSQNEGKKSSAKFDVDEDEDYNPPAKTGGSRRKEFDFEDDDDFEDEKPRESKNRNKRDEKDKRSARQDRNDNQRADKNKRDNKRGENKNSEEATSSRPSSQGPVYDALVQKNYDIISNIKVGDTLINFIGVSESHICLCLVDKESGDWLADEEMFNGEDPLWFSENSHRISPVCLLSNAYKVIKEALEDEEFEQKVEAFVVVQMANIINADDMFEIWSDMNINVTRINRGAPKEIRLFSKTLPEADGSVSKKEIEQLTKVLRNL